MLHIAPDDQNTQNTKPRTILWQHGLRKEFNKFQLLSRTTFISLKCCNDLFYTCNLKSSFQKKKNVLTLNFLPFHWIINYYN